MTFGILLVAIVAAVYICYSSIRENGKLSAGKLGLAGLILVIGLFIPALAVEIPGSETGVVTNLGQITDRTMAPGLNFKLPWEGVRIVNTSVLAYQQAGANVFTSTSQNALADFTLNYSIDPNKAPEVLRKYQNEFEMRIVAPRVLAILKENTVHYTPNLLTQKRGEVQNVVEKQIREAMKEYGVSVNGFLLSNISFGPEYQKKSEELATANQEYAKQKIETTIIEEKAKQVEEAAKGQARANKQIRDSLPQNPQEAEAVVQMRMIDLLHDKWDGSMPNALGGGSLLSISDTQSQKNASQK